MVDELGEGLSEIKLKLAALAQLIIQGKLYKLESVPCKLGFRGQYPLRRLAVNSAQ